MEHFSIQLGMSSFQLISYFPEGLIYHQLSGVVFLHKKTAANSPPLLPRRGSTSPAIHLRFTAAVRHGKDARLKNAQWQVGTLMEAEQRPFVFGSDTHLRKINLSYIHLNLVYTFVYIYIYTYLCRYD